jgi:hypothetical protein
VTAAARLGALHAWRDRGAVYVDGIRTSVQAGLLGAGVAKGAAFTDAAAAVWFGLAIVAGLEAGKMLAGWLDYRYRIIHRQQQMTAEANPVLMRQVDAMEALVRIAGNGGAHHGRD